LILKYTIGLRLNPEDEATGIDEVEHAESGYDFAVAGGSVLPRAGLPESSNGLEELEETVAAEKVEAEHA
jgi:Amt family ammonium transporter